jgi:hypothetical protein
MKADALLDCDDVGYLAERIVGLFARFTSMRYELLTFIRAFDVVRGWERDGATSCADWLSVRCEMGEPAAREHVRIAHALGACSGIDAAMASGAIGYSKVRAITRVATDDNEDELLALAGDHTAAQLEEHCSRIRRDMAIEGVTPDFDESRRWVSRSDTDDGMVRIVAQVHADEAELIMTAIERSGTSDAGFDRVDGLVAIAEHTVTGGGENKRPIEMMVRVDADTLIGRTDHPAVTGSTYVSAETARRLLCDCGVVPYRADPDGNVLDIGRKSRTIPPAIRRALFVRDEHQCQFPGCAHRLFTQAHHVHHWEHGGRTSLDNLITLCSRHHRTVHELGFYIECHDGEFVFFDPKGEPLQPVPRLH